MSQVTVVQYDTIDPSQIPPNPEAVAGYVAGSWPDYSEIVARFPHARHKSITPTAGLDADILDIENGDATPDQAPGWFHRQKARGLELPGFYADESTMPAVIAALDAAGVQRHEYVLWVAWLNGSSGIVPGYEAHQWTFTALGRDLDQSACLPSFWAPTKPPPVKNPVHYDWFYTGPFRSKWGPLDERAIVQEYDRLRPHPLEHEIRLHKLKERLVFLADRVYTIAHDQPRDNGKPSWNLYHRGYRFQELVHRGKLGQRFV